MKALDTGVLLALLEGSSRARDQLRRLHGTEIATTEVNLLELAYLASGAPPRARAARLASLERVRHRLTVLPIEARSTREVSSRISKGSSRLSPTVAAMLGALQAAGCEELITDDPRAAAGEWGLRVRVIQL